MMFAGGSWMSVLRGLEAAALGAPSLPARKENLMSDPGPEKPALVNADDIKVRVTFISCRVTFISCRVRLLA
jgi:hypothetical protein